jgi:hypothetical protein
VAFFCYRSILTIPWIELGGSVTITCAKTGYSANVEFLTKPFYGGKRNRITADVLQPNDKKPFLSITGEWNGRMEAKWADGVSICQVLNTYKRACFAIFETVVRKIFGPKKK